MLNKTKRENVMPKRPLRYVVKVKETEDSPAHYHSDYADEGEALTMKSRLNMDDTIYKVFVSKMSQYAIKQLK